MFYRIGVIVQLIYKTERPSFTPFPRTAEESRKYYTQQSTFEELPGVGNVSNLSIHSQLKEKTQNSDRKTLC